MDNNSAALLSLVSNALFSRDVGRFPPDVSLDSVIETAKCHGVLTMLMSGIYGAELRDAYITDNVRERQDKVVRTQKSALRLFEDADIRTLVLKGCGLAALYPERYFRTVGDVDILVDSENIDKACRILSDNGYTERGKDNGFHRTFASEEGIEVELHYAVSRFDDTENGRGVKQFFKDTLDTAVPCEFGGHTFSIPDTEHQSVSLVLHMKKHLVLGGLALRQICDWAVFAASLDDGVMSETIIPLTERFGLARFTSTVTECCVRYLGLPPEKGTALRESDTLCEELMNDILDGGIGGNRDSEHKYSRNLTVHGYRTVTRRSRLRLLAGNLNDVARTAMPVCKRIPVLLPLGWAYIIARRIYRRITGKRGRLSYTGVIRAADKRIAMYRALGICDD